MIYELREYTAVPGMAERLILRFNEHTLRLFAKHSFNVNLIGRTAFGHDSVNQLVYVLTFESYDDLEQKWSAFLSDPEWVAAKKASECDGPVVETVQRRILNPQPFAGSVQEY